MNLEKLWKYAGIPYKHYCNAWIDLIEIYLETRFTYIKSAEYGSWNFVNYNFTKKFPNCLEANCKF